MEKCSMRNGMGVAQKLLFVQDAYAARVIILAIIKKWGNLKHRLNIKNKLLLRKNL